MKPITLAILAAAGYYVYEKNKNPQWYPFASILAHPHEKIIALEKVKVTSVPTPHEGAALDPNMTTELVKQVNATLSHETDPHKIAAHAEALHDLGHTSSANALAAKANAVGEAKALGADDVDIHREQIAAVTPEVAGWGPVAVGYGPAIVGNRGFLPSDNAEPHGHARHPVQGRGRGPVGHDREFGRGREMGRGRAAEYRRPHPQQGFAQQGFGNQGFDPGMQGMQGMQGMEGGGDDAFADLAAELHLTPQQIRELQRRFQMERRQREMHMHGEPNVTMHPQHRRRHHHRPEAIQQQQQVQQVQPDQGVPDQGVLPVGVPMGGGGAAAATALPADPDAGATDSGATATQGWHVQPFGYDPYDNSGFGGYGSVGHGGLEGMGGYGSWGSFGGWGHGL